MRRIVYTCNVCKQRDVTSGHGGYHCSVCNDYDICSDCYIKVGHVHNMSKLGVKLVPNSAGAASRKEAIQTCIQGFIHANQCSDANCRHRHTCQKMKRLVEHTKACKLKTHGECLVCSKLITLCSYHAKQCKEEKCLVPLCVGIKRRSREQQLEQRLHQARLHRQQVVSTKRGTSSTNAQ